MELIRGESLALLRRLDDAGFDAVVTDPPYSSGGLHRSDRARPTGSKYLSGSPATALPDFGGDQRDQRSWRYWCALWLAECFRVTRPGGYLLMFCDWRQLPTATDSVQAGGYTWRGIIPWDKGDGARAPHTGYFRHQAEYVVWGTAGPCPQAPGRGPFPGVARFAVNPREKHHQAGKPVPLMRQLLRCVPPGGRVLDPFAGSGTTGVACADLGLDFTGFEGDAIHADVARARLGRAAAVA